MPGVRTAKGLDPASRKKLEDQRRKAERAQDRADLEQAKLIELAVEIYEQTGAPMGAIGDAIGYTKQRVHQFIVDARAAKSA